jgi:hypothetical protein
MQVFKRLPVGYYGLIVADESYRSICQHYKAMPIVRVALDIPLPTLFDYTVDEIVMAGQRVIVPFGRKQVVGVVMECAVDSDLALERIKPVVRIARRPRPDAVRRKLQEIALRKAPLIKHGPGHNYPQRIADSAEAYFHQLIITRYNVFVRHPIRQFVLGCAPGEHPRAGSRHVEWRHKPRAGKLPCN